MTLTTDIIDPAAREANKTREQRTEDVAYTLNHAISCGLTDIFVQPFASAAVVTAAQKEKLPKSLHWLQKIFEHHDHDHPHDESFWKKLWENTKHWAGGEIIGDVGGVLPTILTQRFAPGFMQAIRNAIEPIFGGAFHSGAQRDARHWAEKHGLSADSPQAKAKEAELYEHEMSHLPQAVMWNVYSIPINFLAQRYLFPHKHDGHVHRIKLSEFLVGKTFGSLLSNTALVGGRAMFPERFNEWDRWDSQHIIRPTIRVIGAPFGIDNKTIDRVASREERLHDAGNWQTRVDQQETATPETGRS